jgi:hypothetical protein
LPSLHAAGAIRNEQRSHCRPDLTALGTQQVFFIIKLEDLKVKLEVVPLLLKSYDQLHVRAGPYTLPLQQAAALSEARAE